MKNLFAIFITVVSILFLAISDEAQAQTQTVNEEFFTSDSLPPRGQYDSPPNFPVIYGGFLYMRNIKHYRLTPSGRPPASVSGTGTYTSPGQVNMQISTNAGTTWQNTNANGPVTVRVTRSPDSSGSQVLQTEMLSLDLVGTGFLVRESPTLASLGRTTIRPSTPSGYYISSFFDVFTEVSLDAGQNWIPAQSSVRMTLNDTLKQVDTLGTICGKKWKDKNGNGVQDPGEPGLSGWKIIAKNLTTGVIYSATTDVNGNYCFTNLPAGKYRVEEIQQAGWMQTGGQPYYTLNLSAGQTIANISFGNFKGGGIYGYKFADFNGNGIQNTNEPGITNWLICLQRKPDDRPPTTFPTTGGTDYMGTTVAQIQVNFLKPPLNALGTVVLCASGPTVVQRGNPSGQTTNDSTITEMTLLELVGTLPLPLPNDTFVIRHKVDKRSYGLIMGNHFPATSFFDVFFELQLPPSAGSMVLVNKDPTRMQTTINTIPPNGADYFGVNTYLVNANNANDTIALIKKVDHCVSEDPFRCGFNCPKLPPLPPPEPSKGPTICVRTDSAGNFCFMNLPPGKYRVKEYIEEGWVQTTNNPDSITILSDTTVTGIKFGNKDTVPPVIIPDFTFDDKESENRYGPYLARTEIDDNASDALPNYSVDSFFDIFVELSTNSGLSWVSEVMSSSFFDVFMDQGGGGESAASVTLPHWTSYRWWAYLPIPQGGYPPESDVQARVRAIDAFGNQSITSIGNFRIITPRPIKKPIYPAPFKKQSDYETYWYGKASNSWCGPTAASSCLQRLGIPGLPNDKTELVKEIAREMNTDNIAKTDTGKGRGVPGNGTNFAKSNTSNGFVYGIHKFLTKLNQRANWTIKIYHPNNDTLTGADTVYRRYPTYDDYKKELHAGEDVMMRIRYGPKNKSLQNGGHWLVGIGQIDGRLNKPNTIVVMDPATGDTARIPWTGNTGKYGASSVTIKSMVAISPKPRGGTITGIKFNDTNGNCVKDSGEAGLPGWVIKLTPGDRYATTNNQGEFTFTDLPAGNYTGLEVQQTNWEQTCPTAGSYQASVDSGQTVTGWIFGNRRIGGIQDLTAKIAAGIARPGFQKYYAVYYQNKGSVKVNATVTLALPPQVNYVSSSGGGVYDAGTHTVTWTVSAFQPGSVGTQYVITTVKLVALGTALTSCVKIEPTVGDATPADNSMCETQIVRGSYDPNDKAVTPEGIGTNKVILYTDTLTYQIRFQNTGTDTAFTVVLKDTLDDNLDISTLELGAGSHSYTYELNGRELKITFDNIDLPDSNVNEPGSHGFVWLGIRPNASTPLGTDVSNRAGIYFDYNPVVMTNSVTNRIGSISSMSVNNKWNLLSVPTAPSNDTTTSIFPTATSSAFKFDKDLGYQTSAVMEGGVGYWLKFGSDQSFDILGVPLQNITIDVDTGWNMIGSVSEPISTSSIVQNPTGNVLSSYFKYSNGYLPADSLKPGLGYWVKVNQLGQLTLSTSLEVPPVKGGIPLENILSELNSIAFTDMNQNSQKLYFGGVKEYEISPEVFEMPPAPPTGLFDARYVSNRIAEIASNTSEKEYPIRLSSATYPLTIRWVVRAGSVNSAVLRMDGKEIKIANTGQMKIDKPVSHISLVFSTDNVAEVPKEFTLYQNYPNPFNPTTTIRFDLPKTSAVTLKVYNILGQEVATLIGSQVMVAGRHKIEFNASSLGNGAYYYRLQADEFKDEKMMMLIK